MLWFLSMLSIVSLFIDSSSSIIDKSGDYYSGLKSQRRFNVVADLQEATTATSMTTPTAATQAPTTVPPKVDQVLKGKMGNNLLCSLIFNSCNSPFRMTFVISNQSLDFPYWLLWRQIQSLYHSVILQLCNNFRRLSYLSRRQPFQAYQPLFLSNLCWTFFISRAGFEPTLAGQLLSGFRQRRDQRRHHFRNDVGDAARRTPRIRPQPARQEIQDRVVATRGQVSAEILRQRPRSGFESYLNRQFVALTSAWQLPDWPPELFWQISHDPKRLFRAGPSLQGIAISNGQNINLLSSQYYLVIFTVITYSLLLFL